MSGFDMKTYRFVKARLEGFLAELEFRDWEFYLGHTDRAFWLQMRFDAIDIETGQPARVHSRKWLLSQHMTKSEVVQTALKACLTAVEHEAREEFRYQGKMVFGPHIDVDILALIVGNKANLDMRTGSWVDPAQVDQTLDVLINPRDPR